MEQSSVALSLNINLAKVVLDDAGNGKVPKSQTIDPFDPNVASK
jgi:hypothetical protein